MSKSNGQYAHDHRLFDEIASEAKAYWRGFMTANANIYRNSPKLCLSLPNREIRKFRKCILLFCETKPFSQRPSSEGPDTFRCSALAAAKCDRHDEPARLGLVRS
jgi:hypothetical protein